MTEQTPSTTHLADIAGVVVDMSKVPSHKTPPKPGEFVTRSTGRGYTSPDGDVAKVDLVVLGDYSDG